MLINRFKCKMKHQSDFRIKYHNIWLVGGLCPSSHSTSLKLSILDDFTKSNFFYHTVYSSFQFHVFQNCLEFLLVSYLQPPSFTLIIQMFNIVIMLFLVLRCIQAGIERYILIPYDAFPNSSSGSKVKIFFRDIKTTTIPKESMEYYYIGCL